MGTAPGLLIKSQVWVSTKGFCRPLRNRGAEMREEKMRGSYHFSPTTVDRPRWCVRVLNEKSERADPSLLYD
ncbi:hypothetical protein MHYP_G00020460 [Metynnis hypsauchen]